MISNIKTLINFKDTNRSLLAKKNIVWLFFLRVSNFVINLAIVPLTIHYLTAEKYGIWITLSSLILWLNVFDIGLGQGLRNKLATAFANDDIEKARTYLSTAYKIMFIISVILFSVFFLVNYIIDWTQILNTKAELRTELSYVALIAVFFYSFRLAINPINILLLAQQKPAISTLFEVSGNLLLLVLVIIIINTTQGSLVLLAFAASLSTVVFPAFVSIIFFNNSLRPLKPSLKLFDKISAKEIFRLGSHFFIIQITMIVVFSVNNIIISQIFGPESVTPYNITYRYFSIPIMLFSLVLTPFWSAITNAYEKGDFNWIKNTMNKLIMLWAAFLAIVFFLVMFSKEVYHVWIGDSIQIPIMLTIMMAVYSVVLNWMSIFVTFVNGIGKIRLQMYLVILGGTISIPMAIYFAKYLQLGLPGIVLGNVISILSIALIIPYQYKLIINKRAIGIFNK